MRPSYRSIDYSLRPAKHAERKMLCEALQRLSKFQLVENYQYVGFGSIWFTDFSMFHRMLNIKAMISIEKEAHHADRFEYNKPFNGINLLIGESSTVLPGLDWSRPTITWLDYDDPLNTNMIADTRLLCSVGKSGDALIISVQAGSKPLVANEENENREIETVEEFNAVFGLGFSPEDMSDRDLFGARLAKTYRTVIDRNITDALTIRNSTLNATDQLSFKYITTINYQDGVQMTTICGVFVSAEQTSVFESCDFSSLSFYKDRSDEPIKIVVPKLTPREMRHIEKSLPTVTGIAPDIAHCPPRDAQAFIEFYRYLPSFVSFEP